MSPPKPAAVSAELVRPLTLTVLSIYALMGLEWLFFATKPSFLSSLEWLTRIELLWVTPLWLCIPLLLLQLATTTPFLLAPRNTATRWIRRVAWVIPALLLSGFALLLIDNFTYTVFNYGIVSSQGVSRLMYGVLLTLMTGYIYYRLMRQPKAPSRGWQRVSVALLAVSLVTMAGQYLAMDKRFFDVPTVPPGQYPNILILSADGIDATHTSLHGYPRNTTPNLLAEAQRSVVFDNSFSNAATTGGSVTSLITGKLPTTTRLINPPDILTGRHAFQHLPAILRKAGYTLAEIGNQYALLGNKNMADGFHYVNWLKTFDPPLWALLPQRAKVAFSSDLLFMNRVSQRIGWRVAHAYGLATMSNSFAEATTQNFLGPQKDKERAKLLQRFIQRAKAPYFAHVHFMGTHGNRFFPEVPVFSRGQTQDQPWMTDFYDDAILAMDNLIGGIIAGLRQSDQLDNTILIITSDHGKAWGNDARLPLLIHFPGDRFRGRYTANVSRLDIAPTLLEYLAVPKPEWMEGQSLFAPPRNALTPIFSTVAKGGVLHQGTWISRDSSPPFFSMEKISMVICHRFYSLNLSNGALNSFAVEGHTTPCTGAKQPNTTQAAAMLLDHLRDRGYDVTGLPEVHVVPGGPETQGVKNLPDSLEPT